MDEGGEGSCKELGRGSDGSISGPTRRRDPDHRDDVHIIDKVVKAAPGSLSTIHCSPQRSRRELVPSTIIVSMNR